MDGQPERVSIGSMRIKVSCALDFSAEVIENKLTRRSAVRSSAWLDLLVSIQLANVFSLVWSAGATCAQKK